MDDELMDALERDADGLPQNHGAKRQFVQHGAVDFRACPGNRESRRGCSCGLCAKCGSPKHSAIHGPAYGQPPGSKPYGHEFVEKP